jgi:DNA/RNA endonuclease G (NUC1)
MPAVDGVAVKPWAGRPALESDSKPGDPFHEGGTLRALQKPSLGTWAYSGTRHDRGHLAPNQAFSGHICGAGQTFTMANMAPQFGKLNQGLWAGLEAQVLSWAVTEGPIYVSPGRHSPRSRPTSPR